MSEHGKQVTWGGRFKDGPDSLMLAFGESVSFDQRLAPYDLQGSLGHASMLLAVGILNQDEFNQIENGLKELAEEVKRGDFQWKMELEDVHMNLEQALRAKTEAADKLHTGRSRNDQVATDVRLFFKDACSQLREGIEQTMSSLLTLAKNHATTAIPGYTHLQRAQPVTVGHHLLAYVEMLGRDHERFSNVANHANVCPLGSGAIAGSTLPLDRALVAKALGFVDEQGEPRLTPNGMDAVADRDLFVEFASACSLCSLHLSRLAEDLILWNSSEFGYLRLPDAFTTGSSLMPQKKNPDCFELIRGKTGRVIPVFDSFDQLAICLAVTAGALNGAHINEEKCLQAASDPLLLATDLADYLVELGIPFRQAHHVVGALVARAEEAQVSLPELSDEDAQSICPQIGKDWREVFDLPRAFAKREKPGMPGPNQISERIKFWEGILGS
jgi:argininosuccinate lyase